MLKKLLSIFLALSFVFSVFSINAFAYEADSEIFFTTEISPAEEIADTFAGLFVVPSKEDNLSLDRPIYGSCEYYKVTTGRLPFFLFFLFFLKPRVTITNNSGTDMVIDFYDSSYNHIQAERLGPYEQASVAFQKSSTYYISCSYADATVTGNILATVTYLGDSVLF